MPQLLTQRFSYWSGKLPWTQLYSKAHKICLQLCCFFSCLFFFLFFFLFNFCLYIFPCGFVWFKIQIFQSCSIGSGAFTSLHYPRGRGISKPKGYVDGLVQDCSISIANTLEILQSCTKPSICNMESPWWRHQMETFSALLALCAGNSPVPVNSPHKGQWRRALMFSLIGACINVWVNNREAGDLRRHRGHYDIIVMTKKKKKICKQQHA